VKHSAATGKVQNAKSEARSTKHIQINQAQMNGNNSFCSFGYSSFGVLNLSRISKFVLRALCILGIVSLASLGCSSKPKAVQLSGKVTFKGQPVPAGYITFMPDVGNGNTGSTKLIKIKDGIYDSSTEPSDQALTPGAYQLRIAGFDGQTLPRFNQGKQLFNPVEETFVVPDNVSTKDFTIPDSAGQNVLITPTVDP
jgi:hypothetical protein